MNRKYRYLLFDLDMTLLDFDKAERLAFADMAADIGIALTEEAYENYRARNLSLWRLLEKGLITRKELLATRFEALSNDSGRNPEEINDLFMANLAQRGNWLDGAHELIDKIIDDGWYSIYITTNGAVRTASGRIKASGLDRYASGIYISEGVGVSKPDIRYFRHVVNVVGDEDKSKYLVIGDSLSSDIQGAVNTGLDCVLFAHDGKFPEGYERYDITYRAGSFEELEKLLLG